MAGDPDANDTLPQDKSLAGDLTQFFGLFAGLATVLYVVGGLVVGLRLWYASFPVWAVVNQLPRELLITEALVYVTVPYGLLVLAYAAVAPWFHRLSGALRGSWWSYHDRTRRYATYAVVLLLALAVIAAASWLVLGEREIGSGAAAFVVLAVVSLTVLLASVGDAGRRRIRIDGPDAHPRERVEPEQRPKEGALGRDWGRKHPPLAKLLVLGMWTSLPALPVLIAIASSAVEFPRVKGCAAGAAYTRTGVLIAHSSDTLYVGFDAEALGSPVIVALPMGRMEEAIIGSEDGPEFREGGKAPPRCDPVPVDEDAPGGGGEVGGGGGGGFGGGDFGGSGAGGDW